MRLRSARILPLRLPLRRPLLTAHGSLGERHSLLIELTDAEGRCGYGEAAPIAGFPGETWADARAALEAACARLCAGGALPNAKNVDEFVPLGAAPIAHGALSCALLDLESQGEGVPLAEHLLRSSGIADRAAIAQRVGVNALLGETDERELAEAGRRAVAEGFDTLKLKIGALSLDRDLARLAALRDAVGGDVRIRADANGAWDREQALIACERLASFDLEWFEQPVAALPPEDLFAVAAESPVPIAADETAASAAGARAAIEDGHCRALVLKPALVGGPLAALALARSALEAEIDVVVTTLIDSAVGRAAALHVAAALPAISSREARAHGLATATLLAADVCDPEHEKFAGGALRLPNGSGLGVVPEPAALAALRMDTIP